MKEMVGDRIATARKRKGWTLQELASQLPESMGVTAQRLCNYEKGRREPDLDTLQALSEQLTVPMSYLVDPAADASMIRENQPPIYDPQAVSRQDAMAIELFLQLSDDGKKDATMALLKEKRKEDLMKENQEIKQQLDEMKRNVA